MDQIFSGRCASGTTVVAIDFFAERNPLHLRIILRYVTHQPLVTQQTVTITLPETLMDVAPTLTGPGVLSYTSDDLVLHATLESGTQPFDTVTLDLVSERPYDGSLEPLSTGMSSIQEPETVLFDLPIPVLPFDARLAVSHLEAPNGSHIIRNRLTTDNVPDVALSACMFFSTPLTHHRFADLTMTASRAVFQVAETLDHRVAWGWTGADMRENDELTIDITYPDAIPDDDLALWAQPPHLMIAHP